LCRLPKERLRRARNFGLSQVWARRVRRKVVSIIETNHLRPGPGNEQHLQNFAAKVWRILNRTRGKREPKRLALLEAAAKPHMGEDGQPGRARFLDSRALTRGRGRVACP